MKVKKMILNQLKADPDFVNIFNKQKIKNIKYFDFLKIVIDDIFNDPKSQPKIFLKNCYLDIAWYRFELKNKTFIINLDYIYTIFCVAVMHCKAEEGWE